jgi:hypothetical protein
MWWRISRKSLDENRIEKFGIETFCGILFQISAGKCGSMETKSDGQRKEPMQSDEAFAAGEKPSPEGILVPKRRSIRDMVADNNSRFAATMKSLGE